MQRLFEIFGNRELSFLLWLTFFIIFIQFNSEIRKSFLSVLRAFFQVKILLVCFLSFLYSVVIVLVLWKLNLWNSSLVKDCLFWFFGSALVIVFNLNKAEKEDDFFRKLLLDNLKISVVLEFILNLHEFNLITELFLLPIITFLAIIQIVAAKEKESKILASVIGWLLALSGLILFLLSIVDIIIDYKNFASFSTLISFILPIILSISFIPCAYAIALFMKYENLFVRLNRFLKNKKDVQYAKWRVLLSCHFNLNKLRKMSSKINFLHRQSTREDIRQTIS